jgi:UDP-N-acetylmuramoylalanine--D-glutamate ligase
MVTGKRVLILGFGMEGQSTYSFLRNFFPDIPLTIADKNKRILEKAPRLDEDRLVKVSCGEEYLKHVTDFDLIIKSPGVRDNRLAHLQEKGIITSQTDIFLHQYGRQMIGVTGTKGKSTTSSLLYHIIRLHNPNTLLVGNIGLPPLDFANQINDQTIIVYELSSHQLDHITCSPHIAILLNLYQEHLDHYHSFEHYQSTKFNIARYQSKSDSFIFNADNPLIQSFLEQIPLKGQRFGFSLKSKTERGCFAPDEETVVFTSGKEQTTYHIGMPPIKGEHNFMNIMAAITACKVMDIPDADIVDGITTFKGLPYRMEYVGEYHGIHFYNDSIATIPEAAIFAIKALKDVDTIILGGYDRGVDYTGLISFILDKGITNLVFIGEAGKRMLTLTGEQKSGERMTYLASSMEDAVSFAIRHTGKGKICLLSPAAASYDMFRDFKERGEIFKKLVQNKPDNQL